MASVVGSLKVVLGLDSAEYTQGLSRAETQSAKFEASQKRAQATIERQVKALQTQANTLGLSARELKLFELSQKGATAAQLASADAALRQVEAHNAASAAQARAAAVAEANAARARAQVIATAQAQARAGEAIAAQVAALQTQAAAVGKSAAQVKLYELAQQGATRAQLASADAALRQVEAHERSAAAIQSLSTATKTAAVAAAVALGLLVKRSIDAADNLRDLSQSTGIAVADLGGIGFAAEQAGGSLESLGPALARLNKNLAAAAAGGKEAAAPFKAMGVSVRDAAGNARKADDVLAELADRFQQYADGPEKAALAVAAFGKSGADLIPLLNEGGVKLRENIGYYRQHSGVTEELAAKSDEFNDSLAKVKLAVSALGNSLAADLLPALQSISAAIIGLNESSDSTAQSVGIFRTVLDTVVVLGANVAYVLKGVGTEIGGIAAQIGALARLDFSGFSAISDAMKEDARRARAEIDAFSERVLRPEVFAEISDETKRLAARARAADPVEAAAAVAASEPVKLKRAPKLPDTAADSKAAATARKLRDAEVAAIRDFAAQQASALEFASRLAQGRYDAGEVSLREHFAEQKRLRDEALAVTVAALNREIEVERAGLSRATGDDRITAQAKIEEAIRKRTRAVQDAQQAGVLAEQAQQAALVQTQRRYDDLRATILELSGDAAAASRLRIDAQVKEAERIAKAAGADPETTGQTYRAQLEGAESLRAAQERYNLLLERTRVAEESIMLAAEQSGALEYETLIRVGEARANALEEMKALTDQATELALALGTPEAIRFAEQLTLGLQRASAEVDPLLAKIKDLGAEAGQSIASGLESALTSGASLREVLGGIQNDLIKIAARELFTKPLGSALSGLFSGNMGAATGSGTGVFGSVIGAIGSIFGFGGGKALGGPVMPGSLHEVAENRPEMLDVGGKKFLLMGNRRGNIDPNPRLSGAGASVNANIVVQMPPGTTQQTMTQAGGTVARQIATAARRVN